MSRPAVTFRKSISRAARKFEGTDYVEFLERLVENHHQISRQFLEGIPSVRCINHAFRFGDRTEVIGIVFVYMPLADYIPSAEDEILVLRVSRRHAKTGIIKLNNGSALQEHVQLLNEIYALLRRFVS